MGSHELDDVTYPDTHTYTHQFPPQFKYVNAHKHCLKYGTEENWMLIKCRICFTTTLTFRSGECISCILSFKMNKKKVKWSIKTSFGSLLLFKRCLWLVYVHNCNNTSLLIPNFMAVYHFRACWYLNTHNIPISSALFICCHNYYFQYHRKWRNSCHGTPLIFRNRESLYIISPPQGCN